MNKVLEIKKEKIEVTPEMIQRGVIYLQESGRLSFEDDLLDRELVESLLEYIYAGNVDR